MYLHLNPTSQTKGFEAADSDFKIELSEYRNPGTNEKRYELPSL